MRIEIEVHEAETDGGDRVRVRIIREFRDFLDGELRSVELARDHDRGIELAPTGEADVYEAPDGQRYRILRQLA